MVTVTDNTTDRVTPPLLVEALRLGDLALFEARLCTMTGLDRSWIRSAVYSRHGRNLAAICRRLGLEKLIFASIFLLSQKARTKTEQIDPRAFAKAMAFYEALSQEAAEEIVASWRHLDSGSN